MQTIWTEQIRNHETVFRLPKPFGHRAIIESLISINT